MPSGSTDKRAGLQERRSHDSRLPVRTDDVVSPVRLALYATLVGGMSLVVAKAVVGAAGLRNGTVTRIVLIAAVATGLCVLAGLISPRVLRASRQMGERILRWWS